MKTYAFIIATIVSASLNCLTALGTQQIPDNLIYKGDMSDLVVCVGDYQGMERDFFLERDFSKEHPRPDNAFCYGSTGCYRGYVST